MNNFLSNFPYCRPRRLRQEDWIRQIVTENFLKISDLILPIFLTYEANSTEIDMMPNVKRNNINDAVVLANKAYEAGIKAVAIFPEVPKEKKDVFGMEALNENNIICKAVRAIKKNVNGIVRAKLYKGNVIVTGRKSPNSLYDEDLVTFEEGSFNYNHHDAEGFIKLNALRLMMNKIKQK